MADNPKPFHEAIVDVVNEFQPSAKNGFFETLVALECVTRQTAIPKNHGAIAEAFTKKYQWFNEEPTALLAHLAAEKARAEKKAAEKAAQEAQRANPTGAQVDYLFETLCPVVEAGSAAEKTSVFASGAKQSQF